MKNGTLQLINDTYISSSFTDVGAVVTSFFVFPWKRKMILLKKRWNDLTCLCKPQGCKTRRQNVYLWIALCNQAKSRNIKHFFCSTADPLIACGYDTVDPAGGVCARTTQRQISTVDRVQQHRYGNINPSQISMSPFQGLAHTNTVFLRGFLQGDSPLVVNSHIVFPGHHLSFPCFPIGESLTLSLWQPWDTLSV